MKRLLVFAMGALALTACSPEAKIENARENQVEAQQEAQQQVNEAIREGGNVTQAQREGQQQIQEANQNMAETVAEVARDKAEATVKLAEKLRDQEERIANLRARPAETDPARQAEFTTRMQAVETNLATAREQINAFASSSPTQWQPAHDLANQALDRLDESIDAVE